ncbi:MAG: MmgE/PrpD family protein [Deltaproteobacteria bacterium]|nr:MmgE/PrpD family protein [Deltaproteobacteria bacterium]
MNRWTTRILAEYVRDMGASAPCTASVRAAGNVLIDLIGCAAAGYPSPSSKAARHTVRRLYAPGSSTLWFTSDNRRAEGAAMANSTAASALDLDDGHRQAGGHPGAAVIPAVLAVAPAAGASGLDVIAALSAGYEVAVRVSAARDFTRLDTLSTGRWSAYGVVAAAGLLAGDTPQVLERAFAIAGVLSPGLSAAGYSTVMGNQVKEGIPWSVMTGLTALELSRQGLTGPLDILDHPDYFDATAIADGLANGSAMTAVYFKPYACCRWIHAAIDGMVELVAGGAIIPGDIRAVDVYTFERVMRLNNYADPDTLEGAQYSLPFCLAVAACGGAEALLPLSPEWLHRPTVTTLAARVHLHVDPVLDACFPAETGARVCVETAAGRVEQTVRYPLGDPANPMDRTRLESKFRRLAGGLMTPTAQDRILSAIGGLQDLKNVEPILSCLRVDRL